LFVETQFGKCDRVGSDDKYLPFEVNSFTSNICVIYKVHITSHKTHSTGDLLLS